MVAKDLRGFGLSSCLYYFSRIPVTDDSIYEMSTLNMFDWMDKRLIKLIKTFNLQPKDIFDMRWAFEALLPVDDKIANTLSVEMLLLQLELQDTQIFKWLLEQLKPQTPHVLLFSEYINLITSWVMLSDKEIIRFVFGNYDVNSRCIVK